MTHKIGGISHDHTRVSPDTPRPAIRNRADGRSGWRRPEHAEPAGGGGGGDFPQRCVGTYLIEITPADGGRGGQQLWTLTKDGAFLATSENQRVFNFSDAQGVWEQDRHHGAKVVWLNFTFDPDSGEVISVARRDIILNTVGDGCDNVAGTSALRRFETDTEEDPLDPDSDTGAPVTQTFTGRRVTVPEDKGSH